jgi:hypothetical protein
MSTPDRTITPEEEWRITCHEAGHAIVAVRCQVPLLFIKRGKGEHGIAEVGGGPLENPSGHWSENEISHWQLFHAGGAAAEMILFRDYRKDACTVDMAKHNELERMWRPGRVNGWESDIESAMKILDRESIEKVARKLEQKRQLKDKEVCSILGCEPYWD